MAGVRILVAVIVAFVFKDAHSCSLGSHKSGLPCSSATPGSATHDSTVILHHKPNIKAHAISPLCDLSSASSLCTSNALPNLSTGLSPSSKSTHTPAEPITGSTSVLQSPTLVSSNDKQVFLNYLLQILLSSPASIIPPIPQIPSIQQPILSSLPTLNSVPIPARIPKPQNELFLPCSISLPGSNLSPISPLSSLPCVPTSFSSPIPDKLQFPVKIQPTATSDITNLFQILFPSATGLHGSKQTPTQPHLHFTPTLDKKPIPSVIKQFTYPRPYASSSDSSTNSGNLPSIPCGSSSSSKQPPPKSTPTSPTSKVVQTSSSCSGGVLTSTLAPTSEIISTSTLAPTPEIIPTSTLAPTPEIITTSTLAPTPEIITTSTLAPTTEIIPTSTSTIAPGRVSANDSEGTLVQAPEEFPVSSPAVTPSSVLQPIPASSIYNKADYLNNLHNWLLSLKTPTLLPTPLKPSITPLGPSLHSLSLSQKPVSVALPSIPVLVPKSTSDITSGYNPQFIKQLIKFWLFNLSSKQSTSLYPNDNSVSNPISSQSPTSNPSNQSSNIKPNSLLNKLPDSNPVQLPPSITTTDKPSFVNNVAAASHTNNPLTSTSSASNTPALPCVPSSSSQPFSTLNNNPQLGQVINPVLPCKPSVPSLSDLLLNKSPSIIPGLIPIPDTPSPILKPLLEQLATNKISGTIPTLELPIPSLPPCPLPPLPGYHKKHSQALAPHLDLRCLPHLAKLRTGCKHSSLI